MVFPMLWFAWNHVVTIKTPVGRKLRIELTVLGDDGWPRERRGVVPDAPGLYFVGLAFQRAFASMLIGGAGTDAEYVAEHIANQRAVADTTAGERRAAVL